MSKLLEDRCNEVRKLQAYQFAIKLLKRGKETFEEIAEDSNLTLEEIKELAAQLSSSVNA